MLVEHISQPNASKFGINVRGDAVLDGHHTFYLILEAESADKVQDFMAPFAQMGTVEVSPASHCEVVVARGKC